MFYSRKGLNIHSNYTIFKYVHNIHTVKMIADCGDAKVFEVQNILGL